VKICKKSALDSGSSGQENALDCDSGDEYITRIKFPQSIHDKNQILFRNANPDTLISMHEHFLEEEEKYD
jgi:hypothetical protein